MYKIVQEQVFPFIKGLHGDEESAYSKYMSDAIFKIPTPQLLEQIVTAMDEIDWKDSDIRGDFYEYLLSKIATAGTNGQFRTPRHIIRMMVELVAPNPEDVICEMLLTILSSLSQEESRSISENVTWGLRKKFADGKFSVGYSRFLGYDKGEDGNLAINEKQAKTVRLIFGLFIEGLTTCAIAKELTRRGILTVTGKNKWNAATIATISTEARNAKRPM
nr:N-6 DNA methylase [Acidaminococcus fermentans]